MTIKHIAFIMDGNRRYAKKLLAKPWEGHQHGKDLFRKVLTWVKDAGITEATFYAFSSQNFNRPKVEFDFLMDIFRSAMSEVLSDEEVMRQGIRFRFAGETERFPKDLQVLIAKVAEKTQHNSKFIVNLALGYGGREELTRAMRTIAAEVAAGDLSAHAITEDVIAQHLWISSEPDLIIRTGGDHRTSNFLPWQSIYSEWFFIDKMWPELQQEDILAIIREFEQRERRFGQ